MKKFFLLALFSSALFACNKTQDANDPKEARLVSTTSYDDSNELITTTFLYDAEGRIIRASNDLNPELALVKADISYPANEILITSQSTKFDSRIEVRYTLDLLGKPTMRIEYRHLSNGDITTQDENRQNVTDTTFYEYDSDDFLSRTIRLQYDSNWYRSGIIETTGVRMNDFTADYVNAGKNLTELNIVSTYNARLDNTYSQGSTENKFVFEYDKNYINNIDFKNELLLTELGILTPDYPYPLNKNYLNFPNKVTETIVEKDENGTETYSNDYSSMIDLTFGTDGLVKSINKDPLNEKPVTLFYSTKY